MPPKTPIPPPYDSSIKLRSVQFVAAHTVIFGNVIDKLFNDKFDISLKDNMVVVKQKDRTCLVPLSNIAMMELA